MNYLNKGINALTKYTRNLFHRLFGLGHILSLFTLSCSVEHCSKTIHHEFSNGSKVFYVSDYSFFV